MSGRPGNPEAPRQSGVSGAWLGWARARPEQVAAILALCVAAAAGLMLATSRDTNPWDAGTRPRPGSVSAARTDAVASRVPATPVDESGTSETVTAGLWVEESASEPSPGGLALAYAYRTLPPGGESRYQWIVRLRGARPVLDGVDGVIWRMDPPPKDDGDLVSRDRPADGFPLFGDGPGGWFGVSAIVRYKDGTEETLARRVEFPD